jgi:hypothetical protein
MIRFIKLPILTSPEVALSDVELSSTTDSNLGVKSTYLQALEDNIQLSECVISELDCFSIIRILPFQQIANYEHLSVIHIERLTGNSVIRDSISYVLGKPSQIMEQINVKLAEWIAEDEADAESFETQLAKEILKQQGNKEIKEVKIIKEKKKKE